MRLLHVLIAFVNRVKGISKAGFRNGSAFFYSRLSMSAIN